MSLLELKNISKSYISKVGSFQVIDKLNLSVEHNRNIFLFGPSGCGKSTLLNLISGLDNLDNGEIYFNDMRSSNLNLASGGGYVSKNLIEKSFSYKVKITSLNSYFNSYKFEKDTNSSVETIDVTSCWFNLLREKRASLQAQSSKREESNTHTR